MEVNITVVTLYFKLTKVGTMIVSWICWDASRGAVRAVATKTCVIRLKL